MRYRGLGATGLTVSEIGMGTWELGGREWGDIDDAAAIRLLQHAYEQGVTLYDTADQYGGGRSERLLGQAFANLQDAVFIATKVGYEIDSDGWVSQGWEKRPSFNTSRNYIRTAVEGSLQRLGRETIDTYQFHAPPALEQWDEAFETMERLKAEGKIRFYGMALGSEAQALKAIEETGISTMMLTYNILNQSMAETVLPAAQSKGVGIIVRQPLASGLLSGQLTLDTKFADNDHRKLWSSEQLRDDLQKVDTVKAIVGDTTKTLPQAALKFILAHPAVSAVVPGMMTTAQVNDGVSTANLPALPSHILQRLQNEF